MFLSRFLEVEASFFVEKQFCNQKHFYNDKTVIFIIILYKPEEKKHFLKFNSGCFYERNVTKYI